jgi:polar amino acid transport system substrate-binding protein
MLGALAALGCPASSPLPDLGGREVKVAIENAYPPFNQINPETGEAEGWDYDVIAEMARRLNFRPVYTQVPFFEIIDAVAAGTYDLAGDGISITYARAQIVDYSREYMIVRQRIAVRAGESRFRTLVELKADPTLIVGAERVSANYETAVAYFGADRVRGLEGFEATIDALLEGTIDGAVVDDVAYWVQRQIRPAELSRLPGVLYGNLLGFIFPKGSDLIDPINQAITAMETDGTLQALNDKWLPSYD